MKFYKLNFIILLPLLFSTIIIRAQILEIDTTFKIGFGFDGPVNDIGIQSDGKLIVIGNFNHYNNFLSPKIARLNTDGTFDNSFTSHLSSKIGSLNKLEIQSNGQILIVGNGIVAIDSTIILPGFTLFANFARLNPNGDIDMNFTKNVYNSTYVLLGIPPGDADFKIQNDGSILYLLGNISGICKLLNNGNIDISSKFPFLGSYSGPNFSSSKLLITNDLNVFFFGKFDSVFVVQNSHYARHNLAIFDNNLNITTKIHSIDTSVYSTLNLVNNNYLIGGSFSTYDGNVANQIAKIDNNGNFDNTFSLSSRLFCSRVNAMALINNKILMAIKNGFYNSLSLNNLALFDLTGSYDAINSSFLNPNSNVKTIALDKLGHVYCGGDFLSFNNLSYPRICKLKIIKDNVNGILEQSKGNEDISMAPNPTSTYLNIFGINKSTTIKLFDISGKLVLITTIENNTILNLSQLKQGFYTIIFEGINIKKRDKLLIIK